MELDGALFDSSGVTSGAAHVYCSIFGGNSGDGLDAWNYRGSLDFHGMDGFTDYNYNGTAGFVADDCFIPVYGCTEPHSINFDTEGANTDDGSCIPIVYGCTDPTHPNYNPLVNTHSGCEEEKPKASGKFPHRSDRRSVRRDQLRQSHDSVATAQR